MSNSLAVLGNGITAVPTFANFVAERTGIVLPARVKGDKALSSKELKEMIVAAGHPDTMLKQLRKELDARRVQYHTKSAVTAAALAAHPSIRTSLREAKNKDGEVIGFNASFRKERSKTASQASQIAILQAKLEAATAKLAALTAPAV